MGNLYEELLHEKEYLSQICSVVKESISKAPEGCLRIIHHGRKCQYYYKNKENRDKYPQGKYMKKDEFQLAKDIAQRDYDATLLKMIEERIQEIDRLLALYREKEIETVYENLSPLRKEIVTPRVLSDAELIKRWNEKEYIGKLFEEGVVAIYSNKGERVRSKSEKIIADTLEKRKIPYRYEAPLSLKGLGIIYPDFTILDVKNRREIYWEHLGMMDNKDYCENALKRIEFYQKNGLLLGDRLIITYETSKYPIETATIERNIKEYCGGNA